MARPRAGEGVEVEDNGNGTFDVRRGGRAWLYDREWDEVARACRSAGVVEVQMIEPDGYRSMRRI